jgi:type I restriction enzyme S subunit
MTRYKQTNIPWLGEIPEHWVVKRLKDVCSVRSKRGNTAKLNQEYIGLENIKSWVGIYVKNDSRSQGHYDGNIFYENDILVSKVIPYLAKATIARFDGICSTMILVLHNIKYCKKEFLIRIFLSSPFIYFLNSFAYGVTMPTVNWGQIGSIPISIPPLEEQEQITRYLDEQCDKINKLIELHEKSLKTLKEYKQSLIYECITKGVDNDKV